MIEQRAVAVGCRLELVEQKGELREMEFIDLRDLFDLDRVALMMSQPVMAFG